MHGPKISRRFTPLDFYRALCAAPPAPQLADVHPSLRTQQALALLETKEPKQRNTHHVPDNITRVEAPELPPTGTMYAVAMRARTWYLLQKYTHIVF